MTETLTHLEELLAKATDDNAAALDHARAWNELRQLAPHALPALIARVRELEAENAALKDRMAGMMPIAGGSSLRPGSGSITARRTLADGDKV